MIKATFHKEIKPDPVLSKFPTEKHQVAWEISKYFNENYSQWVRWVKDSYLWTGQIRYEFNRLKALNFHPNGLAVSRSDKVKMLMKILYP